MKNLVVCCLCRLRPPVANHADVDAEPCALENGPCQLRHELTPDDGKSWAEVAVVCQQKCLFCAHAWQRQRIGNIHHQAWAGVLLWGLSAENWEDAYTRAARPAIEPPCC